MKPFRLGPDNYPDTGMRRIHVPMFDRKITQPRAWDRKLWGVAFSSRNGDQMLIGGLWDKRTRLVPGTEPTRPLLFCNREQARRWCRAERARYENRVDCCASWRFKPVRVRETVKPV